jgi:tight adherence protein C
MINYLAFPVILSIIALFVADEKNEIFYRAIGKTVTSQDRTKVRERLVELGKTTPESYENFRIYQLTISLIPIALILSAAIFGSVSIFTAVLLGLIVIASILLLSERGLSQRVIRKRSAIESEFPAIIELLTLAISAGESPSSAVKRISLRAHGHLSNHLRDVTREVEAGGSFVYSLDRLGRNLHSPLVRRFVDSLAISLSRGTPLVETLTHSVMESRNAERIKLLSASGKAEISMMIPVVFLILPISILFAMYPSIASLELFGS